MDISLASSHQLCVSEQPTGVFCCWPNCRELTGHCPQFQRIAEDIAIFVVLVC